LQDHREKRSFGQGKFYQFMMRTRQPSGLVTNQLYLVMDELADKVSTAAIKRNIGRNDGSGRHSNDLGARTRSPVTALRLTGVRPATAAWCAQA
jgi:hypothetical protein